MQITPHSDRYAGQVCHGVRVRVDDPDSYRAVRTGFSIAHQLLLQHRAQWQTEKLGRLFGDAAVVTAFLRGGEVSELERLGQPTLTRFANVRNRYLRYPDCSALRAR
jgi:uncharacterized protein YbbC (DUF1343 family)